MYIDYIHICKLHYNTLYIYVSTHYDINKYDQHLCNVYLGLLRIYVGLKPHEHCQELPTAGHFI